MQTRTCPLSPAVCEAGQYEAWSRRAQSTRQGRWSASQWWSFYIAIWGCSMNAATQDWMTSKQKQMSLWEQGTGRTHYSPGLLLEKKAPGDERTHVIQMERKRLPGEAGRLLKRGSRAPRIPEAAGQEGSLTDHQHQQRGLRQRVPLTGPVFAHHLHSCVRAELHPCWKGRCRWWGAIASYRVNSSHKITPLGKCYKKRMAIFKTINERHEYLTITDT